MSGRTLPAFKGWHRVTFIYRPRDPIELLYYGEDAADFDTFVRYTDREVDDSDGTNTWTAKPTMVLKFPKRTGALNEELCSITLPLDAFTNAISHGEPHVRIACEIQERDDNGFVMGVFRGWVQRAIKNANGREGVRIDLVSLKNLMKVKMGMPALPTCGWTFMGRGCGIQAQDLIDDDLIMEGTITSITDKSVNIQLDAGAINPILVDTVENQRFNALFTRGFIVRNGLRVGIRDWRRTPLGGTEHEKFNMLRAVPGAWLNQTVLVVPGCDKTPSACYSLWANTRNWSGHGFLIPAYNPLFEQPNA